MFYVETIPVPGYLTVRGAQALVEKCNEIGVAQLSKDLASIEFTLYDIDVGREGEVGDLWDLREALADLEVELGALGLPWHPDRECLLP